MHYNDTSQNFQNCWVQKYFNCFTQIIYITISSGGPGSAVGIATAYGLDGPGIESRWGRDFSHHFRPALRLTQRPVQWVPGLSRGYGAAGA